MLVGTRHGGDWKSVPVVARDAPVRSLRVDTSHFSDWSAVPGVQLDPSMAHVPLGDTLALKVQVCDETTSGPLDDAAPTWSPRTWSATGR